MSSSPVSRKNDADRAAVTQFHLDYPERLPVTPDFVIAGWVAGNYPLNAVRWGGNPDVPFALVPRPDVAAAYPQHAHVSGFRGFARQLSADGKMSFEFLMGDEWVPHVFFGGKSSPDDGAVLAHRVAKLERALAELSASLDLVKSRGEIPSAEWHRLQGLKQSALNPAEPLVSVCIATRNRCELVTQRAIPSILNQTYKNLELIVVADNCTDGTAAAVEALGDPRIKLQVVQGEPPKLADADRRWMVSGSRPANIALGLVQGDFVTHLDDDDEHMLDRIERLVTFATEKQLDFVYHPFYTESASGDWLINEAVGLAKGQVTSSSFLYRNWLKDIAWDLDTHLLSEPNDWNRVRKFIYAGAKCARYPEPLLKHYKERNQPLTKVSV